MTLNCFQIPTSIDDLCNSCGGTSCEDIKTAIQDLATEVSLMDNIAFNELTTDSGNFTPSAGLSVVMCDQTVVNPYSCPVYVLMVAHITQRTYTGGVGNYSTLRYNGLQPSVDLKTERHDQGGVSNLVQELQLHSRMIHIRQLNAGATLPVVLRAFCSNFYGMRTTANTGAWGANLFTYFLRESN